MLRASAVIAVLLVSPGVAAPTAPAVSGAPAPAAAAAPQLKLAPNETAVYVSDMHCAGCAKKIASRLFRVKGVMRVRTDVKADLAIITPQAKVVLDPKAIWAAVQAAGKHPAKLVGPHGTYVAHEKTNAPLKVAEAPAARR